MDDGSRSTWLIVILLLLAAMLFAVMETAFASVSRVRIKTGAEKGERKAVRALSGRCSHRRYGLQKRVPW